MLDSNIGRQEALVQYELAEADPTSEFKIKAILCHPIAIFVMCFVT